MAALSLPSPAPAGRRIAPIVGARSWALCGHDRTAVDAITEDVLLARHPSEPGGAWPAPDIGAVEPAGLAFHRASLYHGDPDRGQIQRMPWPRPGRGAGSAQPVDLLAGPVLPPSQGEGGSVGFVAMRAEIGRPLRARALAADPDEHLFVLDGATGTVAVLDLSDGHLLRTVATAWAPADLAPYGRSVLVATSSRAHPLVELDAIGTPRELTVEARVLDAVPSAARPSRVAVAPDGSVWLLLRRGTEAWIAPVLGAHLDGPISVPGATSLEVDGQGRIVVAGPPELPLQTWTITGALAEPGPPLIARHYDGRGIVRTPEGRIGFWNRSSFGVAAPAKASFVASGHLDTYRLDSRNYGQAWGRVFLEACVPPGTNLRVGFATADDPFEDSPDDGAPGPAPAVLHAALSQGQPLHRRETGRELPWAPLERHDRYEVYEAPVSAPPGRYLWLRLLLSGPGASTPRVRALRAEFPSHDLLRRLPRTYSRDPASASFLRRYLAIVDGLLSDIERRAVERDLLLDPWGAPVELLPWLASLIGLTLDGRWPETARRMLLSEAGCLFRRRGTVRGLRRVLEIYLDCPVIILEDFRLRGSGGALVGGEDDEPGPASAVVGTGMRLGGQVGAPDKGPSDRQVDDAFRTHAHRFSVLVARDLDDDQVTVVQDILDLYRPAHTLVGVCTVGNGMRVGVSLHLEVSTIVGPSSGMPRTVVGERGTGVGTILGRGRAGIRAGADRLVEGTVIDP